MKTSHKFLGLGILAVGLIATAGIYLKGDGSDVQGFFSPTPVSTEIPVLKLSQGDYISASQNLTAGGEVPVLAFKLKPGGAVSGETAYVKRFSFYLDSRNLKDNFSEASSWSLYGLKDGEQYYRYEISSVSYAANILNVTISGFYKAGGYSVTFGSGAIELDSETEFVLTLNAQKSSTAKQASLNVKVVDAEDYSSAGWLWYIDTPIYTSKDYVTVSGSASVTSTFPLLAPTL